MTIIAGIDEVGRGSIAGPVTVGLCVFLRKKNAEEELKGIKDSKKLSTERREEWYRRLILLEKDGCILCRTASMSASYIDKRGISMALKESVEKVLLKKDVPKNLDLLLDAGLSAPDKYTQSIIIKGDEKEMCISAASIFAKVTRDAYMTRLGRKYPKYGFQNNKGYGTKSHIESLKEAGLSDVHRKTFCTNLT